MFESRITKTDCALYRGDRPCAPNKESGVGCGDCTQYREQGTRWLIINLGAMGDCLRSTTILHGILRKDPYAEITWITDFPDLIPTHVVKRVISNLSEAQLVLLTERFHMVINLDKDPRAAALMELSSGARLGFGVDKETGKLKTYGDGADRKLAMGVDDQASKSNTMSYCQEAYAIADLEYQNDEYLPPEFQHLPSEVTSWSHRYEHPIIALGPGCGSRWPTRRWPTDRWAQLINSLRHRLNHKGTVILLGGQEDQIELGQIEVMANLYRGYNSLRVIRQPTIDNMPKLLKLLSEVDIMVTPVSFLLHTAIAAKTPKLVVLNNIFNKHEQSLFGRGGFVEPNSCDCYYANHCNRDKSCMEDLGVEVVVDAVVSSLQC